MRRFVALAVLSCALAGCGGAPSGGAPPPTDVRLVARLEPEFDRVMDASDDGRVLIGRSPRDSRVAATIKRDGVLRTFRVDRPDVIGCQFSEVTPDGALAGGAYIVQNYDFRQHDEALSIRIPVGDEAEPALLEYGGRKSFVRLAPDGTILLWWDAGPPGSKTYSWRDPGPVQAGWPVPQYPYVQEPKLLFGQTGAAIGGGQSDNGRWAVGYAWKTSREADGEPFLYGPDGTPEPLPEIGIHAGAALVAGDGNSVCWPASDEENVLWIRGRGVMNLGDALREGGMTGFTEPRPVRFSDNGRFLVGTVYGEEYVSRGFVLEIIRP